jgi:hypothetical protein
MFFAHAESHVLQCEMITSGVFSTTNPKIRKSWEKLTAPKFFRIVPSSQKDLHKPYIYRSTAFGPSVVHILHW